MTEITGVALVTGASSGVGAATARLMARKGAHVVLLARRANLLRALADEIAGGGGRATPYALDLTDAEAVAEAAKKITDEIGTPDILVNNAGAGAWRFLDETTPAEAVAMMASPYFAAVNVTRAFLPAMMERGSGHIVTVNSPASRFAWPGATGYTAARWALRGFTEALRADLHRTRIKVTHFVAGETETPYWEANPESRERLPKIAKLFPVLTPEKAANALVRGVERNAHEVVTPFMMKQVYVQHALAPRLVEWLMRATGYRRPA